VRVLEHRAREANAGSRATRTGRTALHPDQEAAAEEIAEALGEALGSDVRVRPRGTGYKVELAFENAEDAIALAHRVRLRAAA
jgi:ParB family transcriptional regulator, chromosome partitioning protein